MNATTTVSLGVSVAAVLIALWARIDGVRERKDRKREAQALERRLSREGVAYLGARQQSVTTTGDELHEESGVDTYVFTITNAGPAVARHIVAKITDWDDELNTDTVVATEEVKAAMPRGGEVTIELDVPTDFRTKDLTLLRRLD